MCGFVGVTGVGHAAPVVWTALQALQHRGQDAAGIGSYDQGRFHLFKDLGLVTQAVPDAKLADLKGASAVGHVRYPTVGGNTREDAQPFVTRRPGIVMAHNGNVTNLPEIVTDLDRRGIHILSSCDVEVILMVLADELTRIAPSGHTERDLVQALRRLMDRVRGAYTVTCVMKVDGRETLVAFRDPYGIRPGVWGKSPDGAYMVASETVAMDATGFARSGYIPSGHAMLFRKGESPITFPVTPRADHHCIFEHIYFARPDSVMEHGRIGAVRHQLGQRLAEEWESRGLGADVVVPIPDTSRGAAIAMAEHLNLPYREGFIKNRYSGRTFIMPDARTRESALRLKLNPIEDVFRGQRVLLVDDSIVRGATMRRILKTVQGLGASEVHLAIFSPPVRHPCFYGIDMPTKAELIAGELQGEALEALLISHLGCTSVTFLTLDGLQSVGQGRMCAACFDGEYVVSVSDEERAGIEADRRG